MDTKLRLILESQTQSMQAGIKATSADVDKFKEKIKGLGQEAAKTRDELGRPIKANIKAELDQGSVSNALETLTGELQDLDVEIRIADLFNPEKIEQAKKFGEAITKVSSGVVDLAAKTVRSIGVLEEMGKAIGNNEFIQSAGQVERYTAQLKALTGSAEAAREEIKRLSDYAGQTPFDLPGLVEASIQLKSFQVNAERFLPVAASLAAVAGRSVPDAAAALGKALSGIPEGLTALQESFRLTKADLIAAGAAIDNTGAISIKTVGQLDKLGDAIERASKKKFGNIIGEQSQTLEGALSNLEDSFFRLKAALGESFLPLAVAAANGLAKMADFARGAAEAFNAIPTELKQVIGVFAGFIALVAKFGPAIQAAVASLGSLSLAGVVGGLEAAGAAAAGLFATLGPLALVLISVGAAAVTFANAVADIRYENEEAEKFLQIQEKLGKAFTENKDVIGKTAAEIVAMGKGSYEATAALQGLIAEVEHLRAEREKAEKGGASKAELAAYDEKIKKTLQLERATRNVRNELSQQEIQQGKTKDAIVKSADEAAEAYIRFEQKRKERIFANKKEELAAQDEIQKKVETSIKDLEKKRKEAEKSGADKTSLDALDKRINEQKAIQTKIKDDRIDLERDALQESLNLQTQALNHEVSLGKKSKSEQATRLRELANEFSKLQQEKIQLIQQAEQLEYEANREVQQAVIERHEAEKTALENKIRLAERELQLSSDIESSEKSLAASVKDKFAKEIELLKERSKFEQAAIADPKLKEEAEKKTAAEISNLRDQEKQELLSVAETARQARSKQIEQNIRLINSERELAEARLSGFQRQFDRGDNVGGEIIKQKEKIAKLNEDEIRDQEKIALKSAKTAEEREAIATDTEVKIATFRQKLFQETEDIEIQSAKKIASQRVAGLEVEREAIENKKSLLEREIELGNVTFDVAERKRSLIREELELTKKIIQEKANEESINASNVDKARIQKDAHNQITTAVINAKKALKDLNNEYKTGNSELDKQLKKLDRINAKLGQITGAEEEESDSGSTFGDIQSQEDADAKAKRDEEKDRLKREKKKTEEKIKKEKEREARKADAKAEEDLKKGDKAKDAADKLRQLGYDEDYIRKTIDTNFGKGAYDSATGKGGGGSSSPTAPDTAPIPTSPAGPGESAPGTSGGNWEGAASQIIQLLQVIASAARGTQGKASSVASQPNKKPSSTLNEETASSPGYPNLVQ